MQGDYWNEKWAFSIDLQSLRVGRKLRDIQPNTPLEQGSSLSISDGGTPGACTPPQVAGSC